MKLTGLVVLTKADLVCEFEEILTMGDRARGLGKSELVSRARSRRSSSSNRKARWREFLKFRQRPRGGVGRKIELVQLQPESGWRGEILYLWNPWSDL